MTVPVPPAGTSASAPAQPASGSASASGQPVTIAKDTVTTGTSVTGLAGVLAEFDAADLATQIAQAVSSHVPAEIREIRVICDLSALSDITTLEILAGQATELTKQIANYISSVSDEAAPTEGRPDQADRELEVASALGFAAGATALGTVLGIVSQLWTGTYTYSGQAIPPASVAALDILITRELKSKTSVPVRIDRFAPVHAGSDILTQIQNLASQAAGELNPALRRAASVAAAKAQILADHMDRRAELNALETAIQKGSPPPDLGKLQEEYEQISARLPGEAREAATAQNLLAQGQTLATAIGAFVTGAVSAPTAGGTPPVIRAAHGEVLGKDGTAILYAQVIAGGDDQVLRQTLIHDTWSNLTGLTAEYALRLPDGDVPAFGVESAFAVAHGSIRKGLTDIARKRVKLRAE